MQKFKQIWLQLQLFINIYLYVFTVFVGKMASRKTLQRSNSSLFTEKSRTSFSVR